ncbi:ComEC/Rec2 family competence protein [Cellulomonas hominis]
MDPPLDLRLVPAALAAWCAAYVVVVMPVRVAALGAVLAGVAAGVATVRHPTPARRARGQVVLVAGIVAAVLGAGAVQLAARQSGGLAAAVAERAPVEVAGTVRSDPQPLAGAPGRFRVLLSVDLLRLDGRWRPAAAPVQVLGGGTWADVVYGSCISARGRLLPTEPGRRAAAGLSAASGPELVTAPPGWLRATAGLRAGLVALASGVPGDAGDLLPGVAVGDTSAVGDELAQAMRVSGLTHLTAVSGAHFSLVGAVVLAGVGAVGIPRVVRAVLVAVVLAGFVVLVHPGPSVVRAAAMGAVGVAGLALGRPARSVAALAVAVVVLLVADPWLARDIGFVLSVVATCGIVGLTAPLAARGAPWTGRTLAQAIAVPVAAQVACAPVLLVLEPAVSVYAVPANLVVAPAVAPATVLGLLATLAAPWWPGGAAVLAHLAGAACWWIATVARTAARLPGAHVDWAAGPVGVVLLALVSTAVVALLLGIRAPGGVDRP